MRHRMTFSNCLSTRQSFPKKNQLMTSLVLNFHKLKYYMHARAEFQHIRITVKTKYRIQKRKKCKIV